MPSEGLLRRVKRFHRACARLRKLQGVERERLLLDEDLLDILENNLRIAIEALLDTARFIIAAEGWEPPSSYREAAHTLAQHRVLGPGEARLLEALAGLRNVIVHLYADVDYERLADALEVLDEIEELMGKMLSYIEQRRLDP